MDEWVDEWGREVGICMFGLRVGGREGWQTSEH